jgi:hypothetical protein
VLLKLAREAAATWTIWTNALACDMDVASQGI